MRRFEADRGRKLNITKELPRNCASGELGRPHPIYASAPWSAWHIMLRWTSRPLPAPSSLPAVLGGFRIGIAIALVLLMIGIDGGIGAFILATGNLYRTDDLIVDVGVLSLVGLALSAILTRRTRDPGLAAKTSLRPRPGSGTKPYHRRKTAMLYELAKLTLQIGTTSKAVAGIKAYLGDRGAKGRLLGCWTAEIGELNKVAVLRGFADAAELQAERKRMLESTDPFGCVDATTHLEADGYAPFPFVPPVKTGNFGPIYEIRSYTLKPGGLPGTIAAWQAAMPARLELSPNVVVMHTIDGPPRFTHIWPYRSLEERAAIRAKSVSTGVWPPKGGPVHLAVMANGIWLPTEISPLT
jgi:hypothetical protein